jgi:hypothetical protein
MSKSYVSAVWTPAKLSHFVSNLRKKVRPDRPADRYSIALDGFYGLDIAVRMDAGGLMIGVEDALVR